MIAYHYTLENSIGGILRDRQISKARHPDHVSVDSRCNWFTESRSLEIGAGFGIRFNPPGLSVWGRHLFMERRLAHPSFPRKWLHLLDKVMLSEPFRIGVNTEAIVWDMIQENEGFEKWYGTLQPVPMSSWVSFERLKLKDGRGANGKLEGEWLGMDLEDLEATISAHWGNLDVSEPPWVDFYKHFE